MAVATVVGVPLKAPVEVLKLIPAGAAGEIAKVAMAPPVEWMVKPPAGVFTMQDSEEAEWAWRVKAGSRPPSNLGNTAVVMTRLVKDLPDEPAVFTAII